MVSLTVIEYWIEQKTYNNGAKHQCQLTSYTQRRQFWTSVENPGHTYLNVVTGCNVCLTFMSVLTV